MKNTRENANRFIMRHLENPNRPTIRELEDLLLMWSAEILEEKYVGAQPKRRAPRKVDPTRDPEDVIGDAIR